MKQTNKLLFIAALIVISACGNKTGSGINAEGKGNVRTCTFEPASLKSVDGKFITPFQTDTLFFKWYSNKLYRIIDIKPHINFADVLDASMCTERFVAEYEIDMKVVTADNRVVHTENGAQGVNCVYKLSDVLPDVDVFAISWDFGGESSISKCSIITVKNGQWTELGSFYINIQFVDYEDTTLKGFSYFLEKKNGVWMYRDYLKEMLWMEENNQGKMPMKPLQNILKFGHEKYSHQQNCDYMDFLGIDFKSFYGQSYDSVDIAVVDCVANVVRTLDLQMEPYNDLSKIKKELSDIKDLWRGFTGDYHLLDFWEQIMWNRIEFHLSNPLTFQKWEPSSKDPLKVSASPDGNYKFYTTWNISQQTQGLWLTYFQYLDTNGLLKCKIWQDDRRFDSQGNVIDVWQFTLHDTTFYVLKSIWRGSSCEWGCNMEIVTFENGVPTYHIRVCPNMKEFTEICRLEDEKWVKEGGQCCISYTYRGLDIDYTFNPKTLTVTAKTQDDTKNALKVEKWKLKVK